MTFEEYEVALRSHIDWRKLTAEYEQAAQEWLARIQPQYAPAIGVHRQCGHDRHGEAGWGA